MPRSDKEHVDLSKFIVNHGKPSLAVGATQEIGWGADGFQTPEVNEPGCLAKEVKQLDTNTTRYFIKYSNVGPTSGFMVDPSEETDLARSGDWTAKGRFSFRPVSKLQYDYYVNFLKTKNKAYYHQAGREN